MTIKNQISPACPSYVGSVRRANRDPGGLTDTDWQVIARGPPDVSSVGEAGRQSSPPHRGAMLYVGRTRCAWRYLPAALFSGSRMAMDRDAHRRDPEIGTSGTWRGSVLSFTDSQLL